MHGSLTEQITRSLAYMLRHQPEEFDLELDKQGWGDLGDVVCALNERLGEAVTDEDVVEAIETGDRVRYQIKDERVRALYGHSIHIEAGDSTEPPKFLYVGIGSRDADRAERSGLRAGRRTYLHLALTEDDAREAGRRAAPEYAVVTVRAREAWEDGIDFYDRHSLFLSESIPVDYIDLGETQDDGIRRESFGRGRRSGGGRGRSGGGRGRDNDRGSDRGNDRGRDRDRGPSRDRNESYQPRLREEPVSAWSDESKEAPRERSESKPARAERPAREAAPKPARKEKPRAAEASGDGGFGAGI